MLLCPPFLLVCEGWDTDVRASSECSTSSAGNVGQVFINLSIVCETSSFRDCPCEKESI